MGKDKEGFPIGNRVDESSWSLSAEDDYIVFCFREDGGFDVVKDFKGVKSEAHRGIDEKQNISSPVNRKDEEKENTCLSRNQHRDSISRGACRVKEIEDCGVVSAESRDSNQSEGSTGSFSFPVLGWEWIGSPVQMPKSEGVHLRKQKLWSVGFQCCGFC